MNFMENIKIFLLSLLILTPCFTNVFAATRIKDIAAVEGAGKIY